MPASVTASRPGAAVADTAIDPAKLYRADDLSFRMGWKPAAWRAARRAGLKAVRYGKRWFVRGLWVIEFIEAQADGGSSSNTRA